MRLPDRSSLRKLQRWGVKKIRNQKIVILAWGMGLGKTITALTAVSDLWDDHEVDRVLIIAPLLVAQVTWPDEIESWEHIRDLKYNLIRVEDDDEDLVALGKLAQQTAKLIGMEPNEARSYSSRHVTRFKRRKLERIANDLSAPIHIINKEALPWLWEHWGENWPYDMVIVDEASMFKNAKMRTKKKGGKTSRFGSMVKARKYIDRIVLLTGSPAPRGLHNLFGLAKVADLGERLGTARTNFEQRYFDKGYMGWDMNPLPHAFEAITEKLKDIMFAVHPRDDVELPPAVHNPVPVTLPKKILKRYKTFEKELVSEEYDVEAANSAVLFGKLLQFANGSMYREDGKDVFIHDQKLKALETIIDEANGEPVLVAYVFDFDRERILRKFKSAVVFEGSKARDIKRQWNEGKIGLLLAHPAQVGHGQNLQFGGNINVWYGLTPDYELFSQWNKRLHRPGQTKTVFNHYIVAKDTKDEDVMVTLKERGEFEDRVKSVFWTDV